MPQVQISARIPEDLLKKMRHKIIDTNTTQNELIIQALEDLLSKDSVHK